ncbi:hypothetical protein LJR153_007361 [Paenibacillus sp. LjRoot153]|uniref:hypothetical protein n=1 Tax=Paenibacillus sp. LjRoot153 TaxID=3342270 RepID=UPI003ECD146A
MEIQMFCSITSYSQVIKNEVPETASDCTWEGMKKISYEEAMRRFNKGREVYLLYPYNTEALAHELEEIIFPQLG